MANHLLNVVGVGNAIVDLLSHVDDHLLNELGLTKGTMALVDLNESTRICGISPLGVESSGGSVANSMAGIASFGGTCAFIGKVADDELGDVFTRTMNEAGVEFETAKAIGGPSTARSIIFVTPDAQRTMNTYLGASTGLTPDDIDSSTLHRAEITYFEGYLWDAPDAKDAIQKAMHTVHSAGNRIALSLSDPFCVDRYRLEFRELVRTKVDILFANEDEITSLYETTNFEDAVQQLQGKCELAALTRSEKGSVVMNRGQVHTIAAASTSVIVDTTGAGDLYAAGFLYGLTHGRDIVECGHLGSLAAAEIISHFGARPETSLSALVGEVGQLA